MQSTFLPLSFAISCLPIAEESEEDTDIAAIERLSPIKGTQAVAHY